MVNDFTKEELTAIAEVVGLWERIYDILGEIRANPRGVLHIESENEPFYLGWVGYGEHGAVAFQPSDDPEKDS